LYLWRVRDTLKLCAAGDRLAQEKLYKSYFGYAYAVAMLYCNDRSNSITVVNDSFVKLFKNGDRYDASQPFKGWFRRILINTAIDYLRREERGLKMVQYQYNLEEATDQNSESTNGYYPTDIDEEGEIASLLHRLPPLHKRVFILNQIEGYNHKEVANLLKISESSSRVYLTRARKELRELYKIRYERDRE